MKKTLVLFIILLLFTNTLSSYTLADETEILFELTEYEVDSFLASFLDKNTNWDSPGSGHKYLRPAERDGRPLYTKSPDGGIKISNRDADWQSLDIRHEWMEDGLTYEIVVEFASETDTHFKITNTDPPYAVNLAVTDSRTTSAALSYTMGYQNNTGGQRGVRLTTPADSTVDYVIKNILIYKGTASSDAAPNEWDLSIPSLYHTYSGHFLFGNIMEPALVTDDETTAMFKHHYNAVTAENSMKPEHIAPREDQYNFNDADKLVDWALTNGIQVHGHTLIWHQQSASWLTNNADGTPLIRAEAKANMENYITTYVNHFKERVYSWDVVNEPFTVSVPDHIVSWRQALRTDSPWYIAYANGADKDAGETPEDYIYDAFVFTRLADSHAILYLNDFNEEYAGKREAIARMTEDLNERWKSDPRNEEPGRLLIEGLGMQAHYWTSALSPSDVRATIERFIATGARIAVTELDMPLGDWNAFGSLSYALIEKQAALYEGLFRIFTEYSDSIDRVTIWGRADHQSWRSDGYPVLFDGNLQAKPAYWSVIGVADPSLVTEAVHESGNDTNVPQQPEVTQAPASIAQPSSTPLPSEQNSLSVPRWVFLIVLPFVLIAIPLIILAIRKKK